MKRIRFIVILVLLQLYACKTYQKELEITQTKNKKIFITYPDEIEDVDISISISFKISNRTSSDRYFHRHYFNYSDTFNGMTGILYKFKNNTLYKLSSKRMFQLLRNKTIEYLYYSHHIVNENDTTYQRQLHQLKKKLKKNAEGKYEVLNLQEFKKILPKFLESKANKDELEILLNKENKQMEYLTFKVEY